MTGSHVDGSMTKGMCVAPLMWTAGWKSLCVSVDGGTNFDYCADIHIGKCFYSYLYRHHDDSPGSIFSRLQRRRQDFEIEGAKGRPCKK